MHKEQFLKYLIYSTKKINPNININNILMEFIKSKQQYKYTHFINNRWENIYLSIKEVPSIKPLLSFAISSALENFGQLIEPHQTLLIPHDQLGYEKNEFWFNSAAKGESTDTHNHSENSVLSGIFYLQAPSNGANLFFKEGTKNLEVKAETGKFILFPSELDHYVPKNKSTDNRISLAFNFYKFPIMTSI